MGQIKPHLVPEHADRARTGAIGFLGALRAHEAQEIEVLLHEGIDSPIPSIAHPAASRTKLASTAAPLPPLPAPA